MIKFGVHGPVTLDGASLSIAADPLEGIQLYVKAINDAGGINGRKIDLHIADDRYTVDGGKQAANELVNDYKAFFISGTLGIDQIYQVAAAAHAAKTPYMAGGGPEDNTFRDLGMYQAYISYNSSFQRLAEFLGKQSQDPNSPYHGKTKVGVSQLNSPYIAPLINGFRTALQQNGMQLVKVVTVEKPTQQTSYATQIQDLKGAGTEIFVPAQDPITTSREVDECQTQLCTWMYSFSDFAHDGDTDLKLMKGHWNGVLGLSPACYYVAPNFADPSKCAAMGTAHQIWVQQQGGGSNGESDWQSHGSGGSFGYQIDHFWLKAMKDAGPNLTRERFVSALLTYQNYSDLVTGPISFAGNPVRMHGATQEVILQAGVDHYTQVTAGLVDQF